MKMAFQKNPPKEIYYRDYKSFDEKCLKKYLIVMRPLNKFLLAILINTYL